MHKSFLCHRILTNSSEFSATASIEKFGGGYVIVSKLNRYEALGNQEKVDLLIFKSYIKICVLKGILNNNRFLFINCNY